MQSKRILLLTIMCLALLAGISGADDSKPVRIGYLQNDIHHLAFWVAQDQQLYAKNDVAIEVAGAFRSGPDIMSAFAAGALDMAYVGEAPTTTAVANKAADVVVIAQVNTEGSALVVGSAATEIKSLNDLEGKTVAVPGFSTVQDFLVKKALSNAGVDLAKVNIIVVKPPEMINVLRRGDVDAFIAWEPYPAKAVTMGVGRHLATSHDMWEGHPCCVLVVSAEYLSNHPEQVKAVLKAHIQATDFIAAHPDQAVSIGVKNTGMDKATIAEAMTTVHYTYNLSVDGEKQYVQFLTRLGYIPEVDADVFVGKLLDQDLIKAVAE